MDDTPNRTAEIYVLPAVPQADDAQDHAPPNAVLVRALEEMLAHAKTGALRGVAASWNWGAGGATWMITGEVGSFAMLGALRVAETDLSRTTLELSVPT